MVPQKAGAAKEQPSVRKGLFASNSRLLRVVRVRGNGERHQGHLEVPGEDRHLALPLLSGEGVDALEATVPARRSSPEVEPSTLMS